MLVDFDQVLVVLVAVATVLLVVGCSSDPGPKKVAQDVIEGEYERALAEGEVPIDKDCFLDRLEDWTDEELQDIADGLDASIAAERQAALEQLEEFEASLAVCAPATTTTTLSATTTVVVDS